MPDGPRRAPTEPLGAEDLARAIAEGELFLVYQPRIALPSWRITGAEALVRWRHPERGPILPGAFIPLAESTGLIVELTRWVVGTALRQCRAWRESGLDLGIAINASARDVADTGFPDRLLGLCTVHDVPPSKVTIELTETATMRNAVDLMDTLTRLRLKDFRLSIDDFGTGYSSLSQLQQLPFSELKIDRSFIGELGWSRGSRVITTALINLAHNLGLEAVAEGVETQAALDFLTDLGCDGAQGYHIARPMSGGALLDSAA
jgi:EAL domain-containing protein (putative c-di-GMP-specific phosphodiesterase class I)